MTGINAQTSRRIELDSIEAKAQRLLAEVARIRTATADLGPDNWRFTGRGAELHDVDADLDRACDLLEGVAR